MLERSWITILAASLAVGCSSSQAPPQAKPLPPQPVLGSDDYASLKSSYLSANPDAHVGRVEAVLPNEPRLAISDIGPADFRPGDVLSIVDSQLNPVADAVVTSADTDYLYVRYVPVVVSSPAPVVGDLAIRAEKLNHPQQP
jgi:hypothetical protein